MTLRWVTDFKYTLLFLNNFWLGNRWNIFPNVTIKTCTRTSKSRRRENRRMSDSRRSRCTRVPFFSLWGRRGSRGVSASCRENFGAWISLYSTTYLFGYLPDTRPTCTSSGIGYYSTTEKVLQYLALVQVLRNSWTSWFKTALTL